MHASTIAEMTGRGNAPSRRARGNHFGLHCLAMLGAAMAAGLAGCGDDDDIEYDREVREVHECDDNCDHYYSGRKVVVIRGHRHGPDCGHVFDGLRWRVGRPAQLREHHCTPDCHDHCHTGKRRVVIKGHRHGPNCGHAWDGRHWVPVRKVVRVDGHRCSLDCHDHFYDGDRRIRIRNHRHTRECGHRFDGQRWRKATYIRRSR